MTTNRRSFLAASAGVVAVGVTASAADTPAKPGRTKNTRFAVNAEMWWPKEPNFLKKLDAAAAHGFPAVEFWPWEN